MTVVDVAILLRCAKFRVNRVHRLAAPARAGAASPRIQWPSGDVVSMVDSLSFFMTSASSTMEQTEARHWSSGSEVPFITEFE